MSNNLIISILSIAVLLYVIIFILFKRGRIPLKYALVWIAPATIILLVAIMPKSLEIMTQFLGFQTISNMVVGLILFILISITISLTVIVSGQRTKITLLIQEISILKEKCSKFEK